MCHSFRVTTQPRCYCSVLGSSVVAANPGRYWSPSKWHDLEGRVRSLVPKPPPAAGSLMIPSRRRPGSCCAPWLLPTPCHPEIPFSRRLPGAPSLGPLHLVLPGSPPQCEILALPPDPGSLRPAPAPGSLLSPTPFVPQPQAPSSPPHSPFPSPGPAQVPCVLSQPQAPTSLPHSPFPSPRLPPLSLTLRFPAPGSLLSPSPSVPQPQASSPLPHSAFPSPRLLLSPSLSIPQPQAPFSVPHSWCPSLLAQGPCVLSQPQAPSSSLPRSPFPSPGPRFPASSPSPRLPPRLSLALRFPALGSLAPGELLSTRPFSLSAPLIAGNLPSLTERPVHKARASWAWVTRETGACIQKYPPTRLRTDLHRHLENSAKLPGEKGGVTASHSCTSQ